MNNGNEIKFKSSKITLILGLFLLIFAAILEVAAIQLWQEEGMDGIIAFVGISVCFTGVMVIVGCCAIYTYFANGKTIQKALKKYGKENIIRNINQATIRKFQNPLTGTTVYFTDKFVIQPSEGIIDYNEISMMYKNERKNRYARISSIAFSLLNGKTYILCDNVEDAEIMNIMQLCYQHNSKILFGLTKENKAVHKERVERFKSGGSNLPEIRFESDVMRVDEEIAGARRHQLKDYILKNYIPEQKADAIKYYQDMTGVGFAEANTAVEAIFKERENKGMVLSTPRQWTPEGRKYMSGKAMVFMGIMMAVVSLILVIIFPVMLNQDLDKKINEISQEEREILLNDGSQEYRTVGRYIERVVNYNFEEKNRRYDLKSLYIFELEDGTYLGVLSRNDLDFLNESSGAGYDIFYAGDVLREVVEREDASYDTVIIDVNGIAAVYGIASEEHLMEKKLNYLVSLVFAPIVIIGVILVFIGGRQIKKYRYCMED